MYCDIVQYDLLLGYLTKILHLLCLLPYIFIGKMITGDEFEAVFVYFEILSQQSSGRTEENHDAPQTGSWHPDTYYISDCPEHEVLTSSP
jgi:hypothetical protein